MSYLANSLQLTHRYGCRHLSFPSLHDKIWPTLFPSMPLKWWLMSIELIPPFFLFPWMPLPLPVHPPPCFSFWLAAHSACSQDFDPNQPQKQMEDQKRVGRSMARTRDSSPQLEQHVSIRTLSQAATFTNLPNASSRGNAHLVWCYFQYSCVFQSCIGRGEVFIYYYYYFFLIV